MKHPNRLRQGAHVVAVGVRDEATRETSYVATSLEVAPAEGAHGAGKSDERPSSDEAPG